MQTRIVCSAILATVSCAYYQGSFGLHKENDVFSNKEKVDKYYTSGLRFKLNADDTLTFLLSIFNEFRGESPQGFSSNDTTVKEISPNNRQYIVYSQTYVQHNLTARWCTAAG